MKQRLVCRGIYPLILLYLGCIFYVEATSEDTSGLKLYLEKLITEYKDRENKADDSDCKIKDGGASTHNHHWGTLTTLQFLVGKKSGLSDGEKLTNVEKLRVFLARIGFLKVPGSLVFLDKQAETMRLEGCPEESTWWMQGERGMDLSFHEVGSALKISAPNAANYVQKYTCFKSKKCSHTFYVITKPLPELPLGVQLREGDSMEKDSYLLNCAVPYCNVKPCKIGKSDTPLNRRSYPPYTIKWAFYENYDHASKKASLINNTEKNPYDVNVVWENKIRKDKSAEETLKTSYKDATEAERIDAFGDKTEKDTQSSFSSRIIIEKANSDKHTASFECILEDANGVVSTPSVMTEDYWKEYRGKTNVHIMSKLFLPVTAGVSLACIVLVAILILACPKKMEYDDGTPYTKEELVSPENQQSTPPADSESKTATGSSSQKEKNAEEEK